MLPLRDLEDLRPAPRRTATATLWVMAAVIGLGALLLAGNREQAVGEPAVTRWVQPAVAAASKPAARAYFGDGCWGGCVPAPHEQAGAPVKERRPAGA